MIRDGDPLNVVVFCPFFPPHVGGLEIHVYEVWRRMAARGSRVTVVTSADDAVPLAHFLDGISVLRLPCWWLLGGTYPVPKPGITFLRAWRSLVRMPPEVVVTHTRFFVTSLLGLVLSRQSHASFIHVEHGTSHSVVASRVVRWLAAAYDHTVGSLVVRSAHTCVAVSRSAADFCGHLGAKRAMVIPNGVEVIAPGPAAVLEARRQLITGDGILFCYVGRLVHGKGVHDLLHAFAKAKPSMLGSKLVIVGDGPGEPRLRALSSGLGLDEDVVFAGGVPHHEAMRLLAAADVFVNPSYTEGLPTTVLEAAALGRAILATDVGGTREIVTHGVSGYLIPADAVDELTRGMMVLGVDATLRETLGREARASLSAYDWETVSESWEGLLGQ